MGINKFYCSGKILPRQIADAFADINQIKRGCGDALSYEVQIRLLLDEGIKAGVIQKRCSPSFAPCDKNTLLEDCVLEWGEVREWVKSYLGEEWPLVPSWIADAINQGIAHRMAKRPAPLLGEGFSEEARKMNTLTKYLELETWTPVQAAMLVCGLCPPPDCSQVIPDRAKGLDGAWVTVENNTRFNDAKRVLELWNSRESAPAKIRPYHFVQWCESKGINTEWLREIRDSQIKEIDTNKITQSEENHSKPWLTHKTDDPPPHQPWYTPARYFAREFVRKETPTLINKRNLLSKKVAAALSNAGISGRSKIHPIQQSTILKAFNNITF